MTSFGAIFAPRPFEVAKEMVRVTKRGGRMVIGNRIPDDPTMNAYAAAEANGREEELQ